MGWSTCNDTRAQQPGPPPGLSRQHARARSACQAFLGYVYCTVPQMLVSGILFLRDWLIHDWAVVLEVAVHVSIGLWSEAVSRIFGMRIHGSTQCWRWWPFDLLNCFWLMTSLFLRRWKGGDCPKDECALQILSKEDMEPEISTFLNLKVLPPQPSLWLMFHFVFILYLPNERFVSCTPSYQEQLFRV